LYQVVSAADSTVTITGADLTFGFGSVWLLFASTALTRYSPGPSFFLGFVCPRVANVEKLL